MICSRGLRSALAEKYSVRHEAFVWPFSFWVLFPVSYYTSPVFPPSLCVFPFLHPSWKVLCLPGRHTGQATLLLAGANIHSAPESWPAASPRTPSSAGLETFASMWTLDRGPAALHWVLHRSLRASTEEMNPRKRHFLYSTHLMYQLSALGTGTLNGRWSLPKYHHRIAKKTFY